MREAGLYVVFENPPGPDPPRFMEVEDETGSGVHVGWRKENDVWLLGPFRRAADAG